MLQHTSFRFFIGLFATLLVVLSSGVVHAQASIYPPIAGTEMTEKGGDSWVYFDLGCKINFWGDYFEPKRWKRKVGGKNVTFSPLSQHVRYDAKHHTLRFAPNRKAAERWNIELPAAGFLSFSLYPTDGVELIINGVLEPYYVEDDSLFYSTYLRQGDRFTLIIPAGKEPINWGKLRFHTNATGVFLRTGHHKLSGRYRSVQTARIDRIMFPTEGHGRWPIFDYDGDFTDAADQIEIRESNDLFTVDWSDEMVSDNGQYHIERTFVVGERCINGNTITRTQRWCPLPLIPEAD